MGESLGVPANVNRSFLATARDAPTQFPISQGAGKPVRSQFWGAED